MPPLHPFAAAGATRHGDVESPVDRPAGNLHLILMLEAFIDESVVRRNADNAPASGAS